MPTFTWTSPDPLNNKAKSRSIYITELQVAVNVRRVEISLLPITFIDQGIGRKFRLEAIEELKTVTNDLSILYGYPTGVQDPALLGRPYVTITKKYGKAVCHYPILNDLRIVLNLLVVQTGLVFAYLLDQPPAYPWYLYVTTHDITEGPLSIKNRFELEFANTPSGSSFTVDRANIFRAYQQGLFNTRIYKDSLIDGGNISNSEIVGFRNGLDITVDENYCWIIGTNQTTSVQAICRVTKNLIGYTTTDLSSLSDGRTFNKIANDKDYIYLMGMKYVPANPPVIYNFIKRLIVRKYSKLDLTSYVEYEFDAELIPEDLNSDPNYIQGWDMGIDLDYLYITYSEMRLNGILQPGDITGWSSCILRVTKSSMAISGKFDTYIESPIVGVYNRYDLAGITSSVDYIYSVARKTPTGTYKYVVLNKSGGLQFESDLIDGGMIYRDGSGAMACRQEYEVTLV